MYFVFTVDKNACNIKFMTSTYNSTINNILPFIYNKNSLPPTADENLVVFIEFFFFFYYYLKICDGNAY